MPSCSTAFCVKHPPVLSSLLVCLMPLVLLQSLVLLLHHDLNDACCALSDSRKQPSTPCHTPVQTSRSRARHMNVCLEASQSPFRPTYCRTFACPSWLSCVLAPMMVSALCIVCAAVLCCAVLCCAVLLAGNERSCSQSQMSSMQQLSMLSSKSMCCTKHDCMSRYHTQGRLQHW